MRVGCAGTAVLAVLLLVWSVALVATAVARSRSEQVTRYETTRVLPSSTRFDGAAGRVVLDLVVGEFEVLPGEPGEPARIEARFDSSSYELSEEFEDSNSGWTYRVKFEETRWFKDSGLRALFGGHYPKIRLWLPPDVPMAFEGAFRRGGSHLELGGLSLTEIDLTNDQGALTVDFDTPLAGPVDRVSIHSSRGGLFVGRLGNSSPRLLEIDHETGPLHADLRGNWLRDSEVHISSSFSRARLWLPEGPRIVGWSPGETSAGVTDSATPRPTINMSVFELLCAMDLVK